MVGLSFESSDGQPEDIIEAFDDLGLGVHILAMLLLLFTTLWPPLFGLAVAGPVWSPDTTYYRTPIIYDTLAPSMGPRGSWPRFVSRHHLL